MARYEKVALETPQRGQKHKNTTPTLGLSSQEIPAWEEIIIGIASCEPANADNKKPRRAKWLMSRRDALAEVPGWDP